MAVIPIGRIRRTKAAITSLAHTLMGTKRKLIVITDMHGINGKKYSGYARGYLDKLGLLGKFQVAAQGYEDYARKQPQNWGPDRLKRADYVLTFLSYLEGSRKAIEKRNNKKAKLVVMGDIVTFKDDLRSEKEHLAEGINRIIEMEEQ